MEKRGHNLKLIASKKDVSLNLLDAYSFNYEKISFHKNKNFPMIKRQIMYEYKSFKIARRFRPDIITGIGGTTAAHLSKIFKSKSIIFTDTEHAKLANRITFPFSDLICTPSCYKDNIGKKQVYYEGYHELAYLHPNYFTPNPKVIKELGLNEKDTYIILRFVSWKASHDFGHQGLSLDDKRNIVYELEKYGRIFITSEKTLPDDLRKYQISVSPEKMHDLLYYATLLYGESATMASECAVLGTHAIFCDYAGRGYTDEEEQKYDLVYNFRNEQTMAIESLKKAVELLENKNLRVEGKKKRDKLLSTKIDVTAFMVKLIEEQKRK